MAIYGINQHGSQMYINSIDGSDKLNETPKYLLDSNICVYILRGRKGVREQLQKVGWDNCCISEMTVAELLYGAECSSKIEENKKEVLSFCAEQGLISMTGTFIDTIIICSMTGLTLVISCVWFFCFFEIWVV